MNIIIFVNNLCSSLRFIVVDINDYGVDLRNTCLTSQFGVDSTTLFLCVIGTIYYNTIIYIVIYYIVSRLYYTVFAVSHISSCYYLIREHHNNINHK